jgi:hypothetical protein
MKKRILQAVIAIACSLAARSQTPVATAEDLAAIGADAASLRGHYTLMNDITVEDWTPTGDARHPFLGVFDGNGYTVTIVNIGEVTALPAGMRSGVKIPAVETVYVGLFGFNGRRSVIRNLRVEGDVSCAGDDANIIVGGVTGANYGTVENCASYAGVTAGDEIDVGGNRIAGGIAGVNNGIVRNCYATGEVTATGGDDKYAGGVAGLNDFDAGVIQWCFATGDVEANGDGAGQYAGGITGLCARGGRVEYCVAMNGQVMAGEFGLADRSYTGPVTGHNLGRTGGNFRRSDMTLTADRTRPGRDLYELSSLQEQEWWTVNRHIRFAFGQDNARPWAWNDEAKRPALYWEAGTSVAAAPTRRQRQETAGALKAQPPKEIYTADELAAIGADPITLKRNYILMNDLTLENWTPVGKDRGEFTGTFNGNGYTITILSFNPDTTRTRRAFATAGIGLFSVIGRGGTVKNLHVTGDLFYDSGSRTLYMGAIAGDNGGTICCCVSTAHLTVHGGLHTAGRGWGQFALSAAMNSGNSRGQTVTISYQNEACGGGIAGLNKGTVTDCYATGDVTVSGNGFKSAGGIVGRNGYSDDATGEITQCYATGRIAAHGDVASRYAGGIAGLCLPGNVTRCAALNEHVETVGKSKGITIGGQLGYVSNLAYGTVGHSPQIASGGHITETYFRDDMVIYNEKNDDDEKENRNTGKRSRNLFENDRGRPLSYDLMREKKWWSGEAGKFHLPFGEDTNAPWIWDDELKRPVLYWEVLSPDEEDL